MESDRKALMARITDAWLRVPNLRFSQFMVAACGQDSYFTNDEAIAEQCERFAERFGVKS